MAEYQGPLRSVVEKGLHEEVTVVAGDKILMHVETGAEIKEVNTLLANVDIMSREEERWYLRLARCVTRVNDHVFPSQKEADEFFRALSQPHMELYLQAYSKYVQAVVSKLQPQAAELKN